MVACSKDDRDRAPRQMTSARRNVLNYEVGSTVWVFFLPHDIEGTFVRIGKAHLCGKKYMKLVLSTRRLQVTPV